MKRLCVICFVSALIFAGCGVGNGKAEIEREITVSAFDPMFYGSYLTEAARAFEALYPGTKVNVETFSSMPEIRIMELDEGRSVGVAATQDDSQSRSDYVSRVNTRIMSGTGADIYAMDIIPLNKFIESGSLENLEPYMNSDPDFNMADYRRNILDALRYRGGIWFMPMDYSFRYYAYDSTLVPAQIAAGFGVDKAWSAEELFRLGIPMYDGSNMLFNRIDFVSDGSSMFSQFLSENMASFVNLETGRPNFADGGFASLLASVRSYAQQGFIPRGIGAEQDLDQLIQQLARQTASGPTDRFYFKLSSTLSLVAQFRRGVGLPSGWGSSGGTVAAIESDDEIAGIQANAGGAVPFAYTMAFGINSQSKNKETAWAFLKFLLSKETQLTLNPYTLPVNNEAREEMAGIAFFLGYGLPPNEQQRQALASYRAAVERLSDSINCYAARDTSLNDMIMAEARYFFNGIRNAEETARVLQSKADLYLSE